MGGGARARQSGAGSADSSHQAGSAGSRDASVPPEEPTFLPSASACLAAAAPRPPRAGNFPSKVILWAWRRSRLAHVLTVGGGGRGAPCAWLEQRSWTATPSAVPAPWASPEPGLRPLQAGACGGPSGKPPTSLSAASRVTYPPRPGAGGDHSAFPSPHLQVRAATRVPAVPGGVVGCRYGNS